MTLRPFRLAALLLAGSALTALAANDPYGDPVPKEAQARLGTARMRTTQGGPTAMTPDGKFLVAQGATGGVVFYEPVTGKAARTLKVEGGFSTPVGISADGQRGVNSAYDSSLVWDTRSGKGIALVKRPAPAGENGLSLSRDGKRLAIGGIRRDKDRGTTAVVWDVDANKEVAAVTPVQNETVYVTLSPDGKRLATWGYHYDREAKEAPKPENDPSRQVQFWDATTGKEHAKVTVPGGFNPSVVVFSPDGSLAATSGANGAIHLFDPATGGEKGILLGRSRQGRRIAFSPDGKTLAAAGDDGSIQRWSVADGRRLGTTEPPLVMAYGPRGLLFADNERVVAWTTYGVVSVVWEAPSGKLLTPIGGHSAALQSAAVTGGGKEILTAAQDGQILRWDPATGKQLGAIALKIPGAAPGMGIAVAATLTRDGTRALTNESGGLAIYELPAGTQAFVIPGDGNRDNRGAFSSDGTRVVQVLGSYEIKKFPTRVVVWDVAAAKRLGQVELPNIPFPSAVLTPDGKTLVTSGVTQDDKGGNSEFTVTGWDLATGKKLGEFTEPGGFGTAFITAAGDNKTVIALTPKGMAAVIDVTTGKKLRDLETDRGPNAPAAPAVSPDGKTVAILGGASFGASPVGTVTLVDIESGKKKKTLSGISGNPSVVVYSPDGKLLITGSHDTTALVWPVGK